MVVDVGAGSGHALLTTAAGLGLLGVPAERCRFVGTEIVADRYQDSIDMMVRLRGRGKQQDFPFIAKRQGLGLEDPAGIRDMYSYSCDVLSGDKRVGEGSGLQRAGETFRPPHPILNLFPSPLPSPHPSPLPLLPPPVDALVHTAERVFFENHDFTTQEFVDSVKAHVAQMAAGGFSVRLVLLCNSTAYLGPGASEELKIAFYKMLEALSPSAVLSTERFCCAPKATSTHKASCHSCSTYKAPRHFRAAVSWTSKQRAWLYLLQGNVVERWENLPGFFQVWPHAERVLAGHKALQQGHFKTRSEWLRYRMPALASTGGGCEY